MRRLPHLAERYGKASLLGDMTIQDLGITTTSSNRTTTGSNSFAERLERPATSTARFWTAAIRSKGPARADQGPGPTVQPRLVRQAARERSYKPFPQPSGKGRTPKPFMAGKTSKTKSDAVWDSNHGSAAEARAGGSLKTKAGVTKRMAKKTTGKKAAKNKAATKKDAKPVKAATMPGFIEPQLCISVDRPPAAGDWAHEIKFDGYRVQLRVEDGEATLKTRKGLDWTDKFQAIARQAAGFPDAIIDGAFVRLVSDGSGSWACSLNVFR